MSFEFDESLIQDFLTESSELIEQLDTDLVKLEEAANELEARELLDSTFRALHTIKGAASFLGFAPVTSFSHVAEDALNRLRKGEAEVTGEVMDTLLRSVDVIRGMIDEVATEQTIEQGPADLIEQLQAITVGVGVTTASSSEASSGSSRVTPQRVSAPAASGGRSGWAASPPASPHSRHLELPPQKSDLVEYMAEDLIESASKIAQCLDEARSVVTRNEAAEHLVEIAEELHKTASFFDLQDLTSLVELMGHVAPRIADATEGQLEEVLVRFDAIRRLVNDQARALRQRTELRWPLEAIRDRLTTLAEGRGLDPSIVGRHGGDVNKVLELDGVVAGEAEPVEVSADATSAKVVSQPDTDAVPVVEPEGQPPVIMAAGSAASEQPIHPDPTDKATGREPSAEDGQAAQKVQNKGRGKVTEQTVRVEVGRLEALLNMVGQLVLNKNRMMALTRRLSGQAMEHELVEDFTVAAGDLDQITSELQMGVMRTRMQPVSKLFDRYPRVIRDIARMTGKRINLEILGKETEVDKSVLELLADPLIHILRNSADHGVETIEQRRASGKEETGTVRLSAEHQGSHVCVRIADDGKGLDRQVIGDKAIQRGLVTADLLATMPDEDVFRFIFNAGFSTADKVSDLSGRGVGMDVVRTNISKLNGTVNIQSAKGRGTTLEILIPLTVAIMPAMMVMIGQHCYAIPLQSITEIVRPQAGEVYTIKGQPVMRLRDSVMPLVELRQRLREVGETDREGQFAVVVNVVGQCAGLVVDGLVGQQEIVIKPLDDAYTAGGPFSGATIREDGGVSLILDCIELIRQAQVSDRTAA